MAFLSLSVLGPFQAWAANGSVLTFRTHKERALLSYLLVEYGRPHRRDQLAGMFWPDRSEMIARNNLRQALFGIRQAIGEAGFEAIFTVNNEDISATLSDKVWLDLAAFEVHIKAAELHNHTHNGTCSYCLQQLRDAVEIVRGQFLEDIELDKNPQFQTWLALRREQISRSQFHVLEMLVSQNEKAGDDAQAAFYAVQQARMAGADETHFRRLMRVLAKAGQPGEALEWYKSFQNKLALSNSTPQNETAALAEEIRVGAVEQITNAEPAVVHNLPESLTPFFDREMELAQISRLIANPSCRLINIVGLGGVGKTRLAVQAARMRLRAFPDGVFFVSLETVAQPDALLNAIGQAIGLVPREHADMRAMLLGYLRLKRVLLVLDNFDQLQESKGVLLELLQAAPNTRLLVTSRERLNIQAEYVVELGGLSYPQAGSSGALAEMMISLPGSFSAVRLFLEQASRINPGGVASHLLEKLPDGQVTDGDLDEQALDELHAVARICMLVDGLPLGIELAASLTRDYTFQEIAAEVQRNIDFLESAMQDIPERQRSLRASFEYSWDLLPESEREVFTRLSVFPSTFSTVSAQAVAGAALPWLRRLENRSLIQRVAYRRYHMHPLLRQFARDKLRQFSRRSEDQTLQQHSEHFCNFLGERILDIRGARQVEALHEIDADLENVQAAWTWAVEHQAVDLLQRAAFTMMYYLEVRSRWNEGDALFGSAVQCMQSIQPQPESVLGLLLGFQGWFRCRLSDFGQAESMLVRSLGMLHSADVSTERAFAHFSLGFLYTWMGRFEEAWTHLSTSRIIAEKLQDGWIIAWSTQVQNEIVFESGQSRSAREPFLRTLSQFEEVGEQRGICRALNYLGNIALDGGDAAQAGAYYQRMLTIVDKVGDAWGAAAGYSKLGQLAWEAGDFERAWILHRRSLQMLQKMGDQRRSAYALRQLGETACALKRSDEAADCFRQSLETASRLRSVALVQDIFAGLASLWLQAGVPARAEELLDLLLSVPVSDQLTSSRAARLSRQVKSLLKVHEKHAPALANEPEQALWDRVDQFLRSGVPMPPCAA